MAERDDILVDVTPSSAFGRTPLRVRLASFVPITVAILGVGAVLLGGVSARHEVAAAKPPLDTMVTGSIAGD